MQWHFKDNYKIRTYQVDKRKKLRIPPLLQIMQDASMQHVQHLKTSFWEMEKDKLSWVLASKELNVYDLPNLGDSIEVHTYPSGVERIVTYRDYFAYDSRQNLLASATSKWVLMNTETRKLAPLPEWLSQAITALQNENIPLERYKTRIPASEQIDFQKSFRVDKFHLDWNGHVNNISFVSMMLETLAEAFQSEHNLYKLALQYKNEGLLSDQLEAQTYQFEDHSFIHEIFRKRDQKVLVRALSKWKPKTKR